MTFPILSLLTFLPLLGAGFVLLARTQQQARITALLASLGVFVLSLVMWSGFNPSGGFQMTELHKWGLFSYHMGVDGISVLFVVLAAFLTPVALLASWAGIQNRVKEAMAAFLLLETFLVGMFCALDTVLFYVFFEGVLIPMFLIIGIWGGPRRIYAAFKFFLFTLAGSILMLLAVIALYLAGGTTDITALAAMKFAPMLQYWVWLAFLASFAVKIPMWPVHTWLPDAHVEAPTGGSVILAGVLLKMGAYGFLRFSLPMLPEATVFFTPLIFGLSAMAVVYTSLVALAQTDMKKLIAYSSVAHMGFVTMGIFSRTVQGMEGAVFQMLSHGFVSAALFVCVGVLYDRLHSREMKDYGGVANVMPRFAMVFMLFVLASVGLPGTSGFVGEFLSLLGVYRVNPAVAAMGALGMVLGAAYMLMLYRRVVFGEVKNKAASVLPDLRWHEIAAFMPLAAVVLWLGLYPKPVLDTIAPAVSQLVEAVR